MASANKRETFMQKLSKFPTFFWGLPDPRVIGFTPSQAHQIIDYAKRNKETLKDQVVAVGPHFEEGINHLDDFEKLVGQYENNWRFNSRTYNNWLKAYTAMCDNGFQDVCHAVEASKPVQSLEGFQDFLMKEPKEGYPSKLIKRELESTRASQPVRESEGST